jgi:hypothetical protein
MLPFLSKLLAPRKAVNLRLSPSSVGNSRQIHLTFPSDSKLRNFGWRGILKHERSHVFKPSSPSFCALRLLTPRRFLALVSITTLLQGLLGSSQPQAFELMKMSLSTISELTNPYQDDIRTRRTYIAIAKMCIFSCTL